MNTSINILHLGPGRVGLKLLQLLQERQPQIESFYNVKLRVVGVFNSKNGLYNQNGISYSNIPQQLKKSLIKTGDIGDYLVKSDSESILIDTSASSSMNELYETELKNGGYVVISNKKPLTQNIESWEKLMEFKKNFFFETTVGAGLPIISTAKELLATGDHIVRIDGCFSGTLGYIFSQMEHGVAFSDAVKQAMALGYTEPDPRDDLSGIDVARKTLILSRLIGHSIELGDISIKRLYPKSFDMLSIPEFLTKLSLLDNKYDRIFKTAKKKGNTMRYTAIISKGVHKIGLHEMLRASPIGQLHGADNLVVFTSERYKNTHITIQGPGAGLDVTAAGVLGDVIKCIERII